MVALFRVFFLGTALLGAGCAQKLPSPSPRPNILLIVSDTLRADVLGCYGGEAHTPNICQLAKRGVLFEQSFANAPWTLPSSIALFTGNYPSQYRRLVEKPRQKGDPRNLFFLVQEEEHLLAEVLREEGYATESWIENGVARQGNATQGFTDRDGKRIRKELVPALAESIDFQPHDERYLDLIWSLDFLLNPPLGGFYLLHWFKDPHAEYRPPRLFRERENLTMEGYPQSPQFYLGLGHSNKPARDRRKLRQVAPTLDPRELALLEKLYVLEVESIDERVGYLLKALDVAGTRDNTLVVFTSDHGEGFGEHGRFLHGDSLYNELVQVPLIIAGPGVAAGRRVSLPVSHVDLVPSLADLLQIDGFDDLQGRSLRNLLKAEPATTSRRMHYLASHDRLDHDGLVHGKYKLIVSLEDDSVELYDLESDPGERQNRATELPEVVAQMRNSLVRIRKDNDHKWQQRLRRDDAEVLAKTQEETRQQLQAIGYLD